MSVRSSKPVLSLSLLTDVDALCAGVFCGIVSRAVLTGKTTIVVALAYLFGFGHVQSDDIQAKKPAPIFIRNVGDALKKHDVVIADK